MPQVPCHGVSCVSSVSSVSSCSGDFSLGEWSRFLRHCRISPDIRRYQEYLPVFSECRNAAITFEISRNSRLSINFVWLRLAEQVLVACFFCDRSCLTGTFATNRQAVNRSGRLPRSAQTDPNFAANVGAPRPEDSLLSRNANKYPSNIHQIYQRISTSLSAVWMI